MNLLVHICCAPCSCYPYQRLKADGIEAEGFFYNPNIHPYTEYQRRLQAVKEWAALQEVQVIYRDDYQLEEFLRQVAHRESERCRSCYYMRLSVTAKAARHGRFDAFSSTLLYSVHQQHELIKEIGLSVGKQHGIEFYYQDFRPGFREGILLSKQYNLYRQQYCGCIYSERDRYQTKVTNR